MNPNRVQNLVNQKKLVGTIEQPYFLKISKDLKKNRKKKILKDTQESRDIVQIFIWAQYIEV